MLTGNFPFVGKTSQKLFENIKTGKYKTTGKEWEAISKEAKDLIGKMLELDVSKRISASECLKSPFLSIGIFTYTQPIISLISSIPWRVM